MPSCRLGFPELGYRTGVGCLGGYVKAVAPMVGMWAAGNVIEPRFVPVNVLPPNMRMELTVKGARPLQEEEQRARRFCLQLMCGVRQQHYTSP